MLSYSRLILSCTILCVMTACAHLIACADMDNQLWSFDMQGHSTILITDFGGKLLNGPNDVWISKNGGYYLTDPIF